MFVPAIHAVADHQLGVGINRGPGPHIAYAELAAHICGNILVLRVAERPDFVALDTLGFDHHHTLIVEPLACRTYIGQKLENRALVAAGHPAGRANAVALNQAAKNLCAFLSSKAIHRAIDIQLTNLME